MAKRTVLALLGLALAGEPAEAQSQAPGVTAANIDLSHEHAADELLYGLRRPAGVAARNALQKLVGAVEETELWSGKIYRLKLEEGADLAAAIQLLAAHPDVEYAEPNYRVRLARTPNDPLYTSQWALESSITDTDIDAPEGWDLQTNANPVIVAVIDTGIQYDHPDLAANMWVNHDEIPGNGIDDDGNGWVDDVHGIDPGDGDGDPMDMSGHGTHVSGTIGAVTDNGIGVAGTCWNVRLMALKFVGVFGGSIADVITCVEYATAQGASIINNSWYALGYSQALFDAYRFAGNKGLLSCAAVGDRAADHDVDPVYPAAFGLPSIVSVMASNLTDDPAVFSDYGDQSVDLAAPGVFTYSTRIGNGYGYENGTSMACAHVSGVAAMLATELGRRPSRIKEDLLLGVDSLASLSGLCVTGGRLNLHGALKLARNRRYKIAGPSSVLDGNGWDWDPSSDFYFHDLRGAITDRFWFGPWGAPDARIEPVMLDVIDYSSLADKDAFISIYWNDADTPAAAVNAIVNFFQDGGDLILLQDDPGFDAIGQALGIPTRSGISDYTSSGGRPLFDGPFGTASNILLAGAAGHLAQADIERSGGYVGARNSVGEITAALWPRQAYSPRAGRLLILTDSDIASTYGSADYWLLNDNAVFSLNAFAWLTGRVDADEDTVVAGPAGTLDTDYWSWDPDHDLMLRDLREALLDRDNFGYDGAIRRNVKIAALDSITRNRLQDVDVFVSPHWADNETPAAAVDAVVDFFLTGGDLVLLQDDGVHDAIGDRLGVPTLDVWDGTPMNGIAPFFFGPFGGASDVQAGGYVGSLDALTVVTSGGQIIGSSNSGEVMAALWPAGAYAPGAGRMVIVTDTDTMSDFGGARFGPENDNGRFALNLWAWACGCFVDFDYFGNGLVGSGGYTPVLHGTQGWCRDNGYLIDIEFALGGAPAVLFVGFREGNNSIGGGTLYIDFAAPFFMIPLQLAGPPGVPGGGFIKLPGVDDLRELAGLELVLQATIGDPGALHGISITNGMRARVH